VIVLILVGLSGFVASFIDGALGMGFGITSTTMLVAVGVSPALASATVHIAKVGTAAVSGVAHHRFGNVDWQTVRRIALPGAIGAFIGAFFLSSLSTKAARPLVAIILLTLGIYVLLRFLRGRKPKRRTGSPGLRFLVPLGLFGGFVDATGGGGWGPVATPSLLADGRLGPAKVVGTVNTSEFVVAVAATLGFVFGLGFDGLDLGVALALLIGGALAAPLAAGLVRYLNPRILGVTVGGFIIFTNSYLLLSALGAPIWATAALIVVVLAVWITSVIWVTRKVRAERAAASPDGAGADGVLTAPSGDARG
jgi:uncharacterized membrane protein YfcA